MIIPTLKLVTFTVQCDQEFPQKTSVKLTLFQSSCVFDLLCSHHAVTLQCFKLSCKIKCKGKKRKKKSFKVGAFCHLFSKTVVKFPSLVFPIWLKTKISMITDSNNEKKF